MEEPIRMWIQECCLCFLSEAEALDSISEVEKLLILGRFLYSDDNLNLQDLCSKMEGQLNKPLNEFTEILILEEACLVCAVTSEQKEFFVDVIMGLDDEIKVYLMNTIKNNLALSAASEQSTVNEEPACIPIEDFAVEVVVNTIQEDIQDEPLQPTNEKSTELIEMNITNANKSNECVDLEINLLESNLIISKQNQEIQEYKNTISKLTEIVEKQVNQISKLELDNDELGL